MRRRRKSTSKVAVPAARRRAVRRVARHKLTSAEVAFRRELVRGMKVIFGMRIDDVYPASSPNQALVPARGPRWTPRTPGTGRPGKAESTTGRGTMMTLKRRPMTPVPSRRDAPADEAAVREEVRKAFMSIRGMHIDDIYPASDDHGPVRD